MKIRPLNPISQFFLFAAGAVKSIFQLCPPHERSRILTMGSLVILPALLALVSGPLAAALFTDNPWLIAGFGVVYAGFIFLIDRSIVALTPTGSFSFTLVLRGMLAACLAFMVSEPIVLKVFEDSITQREAQKAALLRETVEQRYQPHFNRLAQTLTQKEQEVYRAQLGYLAEADGTGGSGQHGPGALTAMKKEAYDHQSRELEQLRVATKLTRDSLQRAQTADCSQALGTLATGLTGKIHSLEEVTAKEPMVGWFVWILRLALFLIEIIPMTLKFRATDRRHPDLYAELASMHTHERWLTEEQLSDARQRDDLRLRQLHLLERQLRQQSNLLSQLAEGRQFQLALVVKRLHMIERLKQEALDTFDHLETDLLRREAYRAFVESLTDQFRQQLTRYQRQYAATSIPE